MTTKARAILTFPISESFSHSIFVENVQIYTVTKKVENGLYSATRISFALPKIEPTTHQTNSDLLRRNKEAELLEQVATNYPDTDGYIKVMETTDKLDIIRNTDFGCTEIIITKHQ